MESPQSSPNTPMGQPISSDPKGAQYVPQPLNSSTPSGSPGNKKTLLTIIAVVVGLVLLLVGLFFWMSGSAKSAYVKDAAAFRQEITSMRDAMDTELETKHISGSDVEAKAIFEDYGKKIEAIVAKAPEQPKVFGLISVTVDGSAKEDVESLRKAATDYASALRYDYSVYNYYLQVTEKFKPIKDLGTITAMTRDKVMSFGTLWPEFLASLKTITPPAELQATHDDLIAQATSIDEKTKALIADFDTNSEMANDAALGELTPLTKKFNTTFVDAVNAASEASYENLNAAYDELDALLKN